MTGLWVSMGLHVAGFVFWLLAAGVTKQQLDKRQAELEAIYDDARAELNANLENVRKMARTANEQYVKNLFRGDDGR